MYLLHKLMYHMHFFFTSGPELMVCIGITINLDIPNSMHP